MNSLSGDYFHMNFFSFHEVLNGCDNNHLTNISYQIYLLTIFAYVCVLFLNFKQNVKY